MSDYKTFCSPPPNSRRLFCDLVVRAINQPRDFFCYVNIATFRYFLNYLRKADHELVGKMVDDVLARDRANSSAFLEFFM